METIKRPPADLPPADLPPVELAAGGRPVPTPPQPAEPPSEGRAPRWRRRLIEDAVLVAVAVVVAVLVRSLVAQVYYIPSPSMEPQLKIDDRVVVSRLAYHMHSVRRGDIIVFRAPPGVGAPSRSSSNPIVRLAHGAGVALGLTQDQTVLIKRVIALPGERVTARAGRVYVNGDLVAEPYLPPATSTSAFSVVRVPPGFVWVMGDNRSDSEDSRIFGPVAERTIIGRAIWKVWPPWRASFL